MKILVCHPSQHHSYRLATALKQNNILSAYVTTVYYKPRSFTALIAKTLKGKFRIKAENRRCKDLEDYDVIQFCEIQGLLKLLALNVPKLWPIYYTLKYGTADRFAKKVAKFAMQHNVDAVITYDDSSPLLFEILEAKAPHIKRILDVSAANLIYMRHIYDIDTEKMPQFSDRLHKEYAKAWNEQILDRALREIKSSQYFLTPSEFVKKSLRFSGVKDEQMLLCPYGVDVSEFTCKQYDVQTYDKPLRFIYVGGVKELKGISYLLEAFRHIPKQCAQLTIVGNFNPDDYDIQPYKNLVNFTGVVMHSEISVLLRNADIFIFPSLGEGLSLATLEAAACGLPLVVSENSGVNDNIVDGREGFIIPIQDTDAIIEKILWYCDHRDHIESMGRAAREMALKFTWERYYACVSEKIAGVLK